MRVIPLLLATAFTALAADGNRLTYLDDTTPFWPSAKSAKFITPQWIGEPGVEAVVILAIDDMRDTAKYEAFLRPILDRLKKIDGRAPVSIMTNSVPPGDPQLQAWLKEGLGWKRGWPHIVHALDRAGTDALRIPPFVRDGQDNGAWFRDGHAVWQNEDTFKLEAHTLRRSFKDLIAFDVPPPRSPQDSLAAMRPRPGFTVELVAAEPLVESPVAFEWDARGRLWVVEMRDYPLGMDGKGKPGGVIKVLTDTKGDGHFDQAKILAEGIPYPTGIFPWRDGVIVAAAPDIIFLRDKNGDGSAVERTVLFTGFTLGNQQHRINGFDWGLDGWLYGANGDSGGSIVPGAAKDRAEQKGVSISGRDFRFRPDTGEFEAESGSTQYGRHRDDWGNWFGNNNPAWLWHYVIEDRYIRRNPRLAVKTTKQPLANYADNTRVFTAYPRESAPMRFNQPQSLGYVTSANSANSANSATPYCDELFGCDFAGSVFVSEAVHNAVHREWIAPETQSRLDLRAVADKPDDWLLAALFDPNAAVEPRYQALVVKLKNGTELSGIVAGETANNLTLRLPGGADFPVLRADIAEEKAAGRSLMPEGLETVLQPQDVADVIAWLRAK